MCFEGSNFNIFSNVVLKAVPNIDTSFGDKTVCNGSFCEGYPEFVPFSGGVSMASIIGCEEVVKNSWEKAVLIFIHEYAARLVINFR